ncbi:MAG TPA: asparaginase [Jatrophihabitans sp.]|nr:asparaginase [Jatrophihabitans sp.]
MSHVAFFALGGTISMTHTAGDGAVPRLTSAQLLATIGKLSTEVRVHDLTALPGGSLTVDNVLDAFDAARRAVQDGAVGVVMTQGTDTIEETAFLLDSIWDHDEPFVVTGAMRNPSLAGADGPANLLAALTVAASPAARGRGVLVGFMDQIHAARHVRKTHSTSPATFASPDLGPIGHVIEGVPRFLAQLPPRVVITNWSRERVAATKIALYTVTFDDDGALLAGPEHSHHGLVVAGFGAGHVPAALVPALVEVNEVMPVVFTSRAGAGPVLHGTYGAPGSERDLLARGLISGGLVHPYQARLLLRLLVAAGATRAEIAAAYAALG